MTPPATSMKPEEVGERAEKRAASTRLVGVYLEDHPRYRKWLVTPIYKPVRAFIRETIPPRGFINHGY